MNRTRILAAILVSILMGMVLTGCQKKNTPVEFTQAILDLRLQGQADAAAELVRDQKKSELLEDYTAGIQAFNEVYITGGMEMSDSLTASYSDLCKEIFLAARYNVTEARESTDGEYEVTVEITPLDVFETYLPKLKEESDRLLEKAENGEYEGSKEEINEQVQQEFAYSAYTLLENSYLDMEYKDKKLVTISVVEEEKGEYSIAEADIWEFVTKLLALDEIQG